MKTEFLCQKILKNADGVECWLPYYPVTFRALLDDESSIRLLDVLKSKL